jgi:hypothetical protein
MPNPVALDRDALYYPYIQIHDVNWLKSTLLCFPSVHRIVPVPWETSVVGDTPEIERFCRTVGARGPLLQACNLAHTQTATNELLHKLQQNENVFIPRYSFAGTKAEYGEADWFKLHDTKVSYSLTHYLEGQRLAWRGSGGPWIMMHPKLGAAIMSTIALAIARRDGLDIVTPSDETHYVASFSDDRHIFENLLREDPLLMPPSRDNLTDDLAELVMTTLFDVGGLTPEQIAELQKDGKDLRRFKNAIASIAAQIPNIADPEARLNRLHESAAEVVDEWNTYKRGLPRFALEALINAGDIKPPEWSAALLAGASTHHVLGLGKGIIVGVLTYAGTKVLRAYRQHRSSPYRYLTRIYREGATLKTPIALKQTSQHRLKF